MPSAVPVVGPFAALFLLVSVSLAAEIDFGAGVDYETGIASGLAGASMANPGNAPLQQYMPVIFLEQVFRNRRTQGAFGYDLNVSWAASEDPAYVDAYRPFALAYSGGANPNGDPGISGINPELFLGADLAYHFPAAGPLDVALSAGAVGWQDIGDTSQIELPISAGVALQTAVALTLRLGGFFIQGKGLWRPYFWEAAAAGGAGTPSPLGTYGVMLLGGFSLPSTLPGYRARGPSGSRGGYR